MNGIGKNVWNLCGEKRVEPGVGKRVKLTSLRVLLRQMEPGGGKTRETSCIITSRGTGGEGTRVRREFIASNPRNSAWGPRVAWITARR